MDLEFTDCNDLLQQLDFYVKMYAEGNWIVAVNCKSEKEKKGIHSWAHTQKLQHVSAKTKLFSRECSFKCRNCRHLFNYENEFKKYSECANCKDKRIVPWRNIQNTVLIAITIPEKMKSPKKKNRTKSNIPWNPEDEINLLKEIPPREITLILEKDLELSILSN